MKKIVLIAAALLMTTGAFAQFSWGVKGGANLANLTKTTPSTKFKPSIYVGAFAEYKFSEYFSIQPELIYSRQGFYYKGDMENIDGKMWLRLNYINIPILAKVHIIEKLSIDLGPQIGFMLNDKIKVKAGSTTVTADSGLDTKAFDVSIAMGATYTIAEKFDISARYNLGLTEVVKDSKSKNSVIQIGVGYRF